MMRLIKVADKIQSQIDSTFTKAYQALQKANVVEGISMVRQISQAIPVDNSISIRFRSVMGVEIPEISYKEQHISPTYGFMGVVIALDEAYVHFEQVRRLSLIHISCLLCGPRRCTPANAFNWWAGRPTRTR